jgi:hypothetical protein
MNSITKMRRINYSAKRNQIKVYKGKFGKFNLENNVFRDAHKVICYTNLKKLCNFGGFRTFGDIGTGIILSKNREIAKVFFGDFEKFGDMDPVV